MRKESKKMNTSFMSRLGETLQNRDQFSQKFDIKLDKSMDSLPSKMGALCSLLLYFILIAYAY